MVSWRSTALLAALALVAQASGQTLFPLHGPDDAPSPGAPPRFDLLLLGDEPVRRALEQGTPELVKDPLDGKPCFAVRTKQAGMRIDEPAFVTADTELAWSWKKDKGQVTIVQVGLKNPETGQTRYLGYAAGQWAEPPSADPTIEITVAPTPPREWNTQRRRLLDDIRKTLGWSSAQVTSFFLSPWDGEPGWFREAAIRRLARADEAALARSRELEFLSRVGRGQYVPLRLKNVDEKRVEKFEASFEECAPGRNSAANEWTAFGAIGNFDFNCMGRDLRVRYPAFDLVFRLDEGRREIEPGSLDTFRLGLVGQRMPAIWAGWRHEGLLYKVSVMTIPSAELGNFDLYKLQIQNPTKQPIASRLVAGLDGPPDMRLDQSVVRGLAGAPFVVVDPPDGSNLVLRDWGLCDKRAKAYATGGGPGKTEPAIATYRLGLDGLPVVYRVKVEPKKKHVVYLAATPHISGHLLERPTKPGDLVYEYRVEGALPKTLDWIEWTRKHPLPLCVGFDAAHDVDGDGYLEVGAGVAATSRIRHTRLSAIYVFPEGTKVENLEAVTSGAMNAQCLRHVDVGATPEQDPAGYYYDKSDVGLARLALRYGGTVAPGETKTWWLKVPAIHRRQPVSMGYIAHAFRDVLPGEAVPPVSPETLARLKGLDPRTAETELARFWAAFFEPVAKFEVPDPVLVQVLHSRLATRAILDVNLDRDLCYNACSPFFYFDHAYRDQAYVVYAFDLAGLADRSRRLLEVYCRDVKDVPPGPIAFDGKPLQLGMLPSGLWNTRPGQWDTQGQNLWALVEHWKLTGDRAWLTKTAYPYIRRGAMWLVNSRRKHMAEVKDPADPRHGLLEPGAMEVMEVGRGMHMYYLNAFGVLGLREAADAAAAAGAAADAQLFAAEGLDLKRSLARSFRQTRKRTGLYEGHLWFGVEPEGVGMYGFWAHNCLVWPCRAVDPHDPMLTATWRKMEAMSNAWGGGLHSEGQGGFWPYIGVDRAMSYLLRGEPDRALDYFCAMTDTAGSTFSWGEGYSNLIAGGDQPHMWADAQWINLFRHLFVFEDGQSLWLTPALFRRWHEPGRRVAVSDLPTHFGRLDLTIEPDADGRTIRYHVRIAPRGDQAERPLERIVLYPRIPGGRPIAIVAVDGKPIKSFTRDAVVLVNPPRGREMHVEVMADR
ncbi:MAG: hypothetical protein NUV77_04925 [Thermoguttaceae bacterium]|jgi:hypothetical protein|nr:hypothetical protein [Thermoguttaceae bacterium]